MAADRHRARRARLLFGSRLWPGVALGAFFVNWTASEPALTAAGIAAGLLVAVFVTRALAGLLFGVTPLDGRTFAGVPLALALVALLAAWIPTWRASRIDPNEVLRHE